MNGIAIVTGTSAGIGFEVASALVDRGWNVVGIARRPARIENDRYRHIALDLSDSSALAATIDAELGPVVRREWARVGLVNNAASAVLGPLENADAVELDRTISVSLVAPLALMAAVSRHTPRDRPLRVVNVSSAASTNAFAGLSTYGASKAGLRLAGMVLGAEWASTVAHAPTRKDAAILSYEPGIVDTGMQEMARTCPPQQMPWVGMFQQFAREGRLVPAALPAKDIVAFLESKNQPTFAERRLEAAR